MDKYKDKKVLIGFALSDRRTEKYVPPPPPKYTSFSGQGVSMGGGPAQPQQMQAVDTSVSAGKPAVDPSQPTT